MLKIAILGPESTGKSQLAEDLAEHFQAPWVPEYARTYVEKLNQPYTFEDICNIANEQIKEEKSIEKQPKSGKFIFFDTDLIITKVWFEYCFGKCPEFVTNRLAEGFFDLYLLCSPDLEWVPDSVREHGADRDFFFNWYKKEIELLQKPYVIISGQGKERIHQAIAALSNLQTPPVNNKEFEL